MICTRESTRLGLIGILFMIVLGNILFDALFLSMCNLKGDGVGCHFWQQNWPLILPIQGVLLCFSCVLTGVLFAFLSDYTRNDLEI